MSELSSLPLSGQKRLSSTAVLSATARPSFGDYELLEEIARGGMGVVYKARQRSLNRIVAVKMILEGRLASETAVQRFQQEAQSAAALDHPGIVPIYEVGQAEGRHYFSMAFVEGESLAARVRQRGVPEPGEAAALVLAVAQAVDYAHQRGVIHRDLKPENVLLDKQSRPRVTDFGVAKRVEASSGLTASGELLGTPRYMAPEQALEKHKALGPHTDVYALGGILYFLLTGQAPFLGDSLGEVLCQVVSQPPTPPRQVNAQVPEGLEAVCLKCLEKDPALRYATAAELAAALLPWASEVSCTSTSAPPIKPSERLSPSWASAPAPPAGRRLLWLWAGLAGCGLALLALVGFLAQNQPERTPPEPIAVRPETPRPVLDMPSQTSAPTPPKRMAPTPASTPPKGPAQALVSPAPPKVVQVPVSPPPARVDPVPVPSHHDFGLKVEMLGAAPGATEEHRLMEGQEVVFQIEVERDAYVGIWSVDPEGVITQVFPNDNEPNHFLRAGKRTVPGLDYGIEATPASGAERVWIVASTKPWDPLQARRRRGPYLVFQTAQERQDWQEQVRTRGLLVKPMGDRGKAALAEQVLVYRVFPRR